MPSTYVSTYADEHLTEAVRLISEVRAEVNAVRSALKNAEQAERRDQALAAVETALKAASDLIPLVGTTDGSFDNFSRLQDAITNIDKTLDIGLVLVGVLKDEEDDLEDEDDGTK